MATLRYGDQSLASFPDNISGLITADDMRSVIVSQRSGGGQVLGVDPFTVPITDGVPTQINPLITNPSVSSGFWAADGNNRQYPNYAALIPDLVIPAGYQKFAQVFFTVAANKVGQGEDAYLFQLDIDGVAVGTGVTYTLTPDPTVISLLVNKTVTLDGGALLGLTVTGVGTSDDIEIEAFEQFTIDFQIWNTP